MRALIQLDSNQPNTFLGFVCGILGGTVDFVIRAKPLFIVGVFQAAFTAAVCGAAGVAGKELYTYAKKWYKARKRRK